MDKQRYDELIDGWRDGFVPDTDAEEALKDAVLECLAEIARLNGW